MVSPGFSFKHQIFGAFLVQTFSRDCFQPAPIVGSHGRH